MCHFIQLIGTWWFSVLNIIIGGLEIIDKAVWSYIAMYIAAFFIYHPPDKSHKFLFAKMNSDSQWGNGNSSDNQRTPPENHKNSLWDLCRFDLWMFFWFSQLLFTNHNRFSQNPRSFCMWERYKNFIIIFIIPAPLDTSSLLISPSSSSSAFVYFFSFFFCLFLFFSFSVF